jgi:hypothetical protein
MGYAYGTGFTQHLGSGAVKYSIHPTDCTFGISSGFIHLGLGLKPDDHMKAD